MKNEEKKIHAIYVRVSTEGQVEKYSIPAQLETLKSHVRTKCLEKNLEYKYKIYEDPGYSGATLDRPAIKELIQDCFDGKILGVYVFKLDRLSRNPRDTLYLINDVFKKCGVSFNSYSECFDPNTSIGEAMLSIISTFAQLERQTILERTRIGLQKRAEDGYWRGGGKTPFVYDYDKKTGMLVVNEKRKVIFNLMKTLRLEGHSYHRLSEITGYDESWIQSILNAKTNLGKIPYKGNLYEGRHEAVITESEYEQLQEIEKQRSKNQRASHYLLSGKIFCGKCGAKYRYQKWGKRIICYCYSQQKSKPKLIKDPNCDNIRIDSYEIENNFLEQLFAMPLDEYLFKETFNLSKINLINELNIRLDKTQKKIDNLIQLLSDDIANDEIKIQLVKFKNEKSNLIEQLKDTKKNEKKIKTFDIIKNFGIVWQDMEFKEKRIIIEQLVDKIVVDGKSLKIYWNVSGS